MKRGILSVLLALAAAGSASAFDSVEALMKDIQEKQVAALQEYIAQHPQAADLADAEDALAYSLMMTGREEEASALLLKKYEQAVAKMDDLELDALFGGVVFPLVQVYRKSGDKTKATDFIARVKKDFADHEMAAMIGGALDQMGGSLETPAVGETLDLKFTATDGREVDLAALKGKVVLVEFWATWCGPCIKELPAIKAAYDKLHAQGFEIVAISLDDDRAKLDAFVKKENLPWPQYFDGKKWDNDIAVRFGVNSIPAAFLIGKDGKVAATGVRGQHIEAKAAELLAQ